MFVKIVEESAVNWCLCRVLWPSGKTSTGELHNREERDNFLDQRKLWSSEGDAPYFHNNNIKGSHEKKLTTVDE